MMIFLIFEFLAITFSSASTDMSLVEYMSQPAQPLNAVVTVNEEESESTKITAAGGTIELQTSDGSVFELTVPAGALVEPTTITISVITGFGNSQLVFDQPVMGVQLTPEGLLFAKPASLKISPAHPIAISHLVPITADHDGKDVRIASLAPDKVLASDSVELSLNHFSPYVLTGTQTVREKILKAFNSLAASRLEAWAGDQILKMKQGNENDPAIYQKMFEDAFETVVKVHVGSVESCEGGIESQRTLLSWMRQAELLGIDHSVLAHDNFKTALVSKTAKLCRERARVACYDDHRVFDVIQFALGVSRQAQLLGVENDPNADALMELALKCSHFEFKMESTFKTNDPGEVVVTAQSRIDFWFENFYTEPASRGFVQVTDMSLDLEGVDCQLTRLDAPAAESSISGFGLKDPRFDQSLGVFIHGLYPKNIGYFTCTDDSSPPFTFDISMPMYPGTDSNESFWGGMFLAFHSQSHANEYNEKKGQYEIFKWDVQYGEIFATKTYKRKLEMLEEDTTMTVYHRPVL